MWCLEESWDSSDRNPGEMLSKAKRHRRASLPKHIGAMEQHSSTQEHSGQQLSNCL